MQGYTLHEKRLQERGIEIGQALALLQQTLANQSLVNAEGAAVLAVVQDYAKSWSLLQGYDEQNLVAVTARQHDMRPLAFEDVLAALAELKTALIAKGEATELFGQLRGDGLASAIATIEQGFGDSYFYPNIASRAAHRLYFVIKNHPLADGNKRSGAFLFLWYLRLNAPLLGKPVEQLITDNTLVALALLVAESLPRKRTSLSALSNTSSRYARDKSCFRTQKNRAVFLRDMLLKFNAHFVFQFHLAIGRHGNLPLRQIGADFFMLEGFFFNAPVTGNRLDDFYRDCFFFGVA